MCVKVFKILYFQNTCCIFCILRAKYKIHDPTVGLKFSSTSTTCTEFVKSQNLTKVIQKCCSMLTTDKCISVHHFFAHDDTIQQFTPFWGPIYFGDRFILAGQNIRPKTAYAGLYCKALQFTKYFVKVFYVYKKKIQNT